MLTYGDGLSNIDINALLDFHKAHGKLATMTAVRPPARFGGLEFREDGSIVFTEKPQIGEGWINGGFMVLEPAVLDRIEGDETNFERDVLESLSEDGELMAYKHEDFWQCIDTMRDLRLVRAMWDSNERPWLTA
ncbi:MAG: glucose-1-phosphate cytidylyltransferase, partial [Actinobacteria bacterium]|nr:glucose-1-phosphate cytidylyltransferase [Actinomycetota bacterium]